MNLPCNDAQLLVMSYLDGQLSEAQAAPLRKHLLECQPCRASAQDHKNTTRWFVRPEPVAVPRDFAARVARRAFQGDRGEQLVEVGASREIAGASFAQPEAREPWAREASSRENGRMLRFVLGLTSVAAAAAICISIAVRSLTLPSGDHMAADDRTPVLPLDEALQALDKLNAKDAAHFAQPATAHPGANPARGDSK